MDRLYWIVGVTALRLNPERGAREPLRGLGRKREREAATPVCARARDEGSRV
jgi:hypothetical protein